MYLFFNKFITEYIHFLFIDTYNMLHGEPLTRNEYIIILDQNFIYFFINSYF